MLETLQKQKDYFDLSKLSERQQKIYQNLIHYKDRFGHVHCLGYLNSRGKFELSKKIMLEVTNNDEGNEDSRINELLTEFNQGTATARNMNTHIVTSGHGDMGLKGDSFFDRLLVSTSNNPTDMDRTIFGLINLAKKMMTTTPDLAQKDDFIQTLSQIILLNFQAGTSPEQMQKYTRYFSEIDIKTKKEIQEKIKKMAFELPLLTYFNAKNTIKFNSDMLRRMKVLDETKNPSSIVMQRCEEFFETDLSKVDVYINNLSSFGYLPSEDQEEIDKIKLKPEIYTLLDNLFAD